MLMAVFSQRLDGHRVKTEVTSRDGVSACTAPAVYQFGTGVFLLGFVDWIFEQLNQRADLGSRLIALKARPGDNALIDAINARGGRYDVHLRGLLGGEPVDRKDPVMCLTQAINPFSDHDASAKLAVEPSWQWVVSNTTEAGIQYAAHEPNAATVPQSFPALLAWMLWQRFSHCGEQDAPGVQVLCCELIEGNATRLKAIIKQHAEDWLLGSAFHKWLDSQCGFYNTLVDRIVTGGDAIWQSQADSVSIMAEPFYDWVIEAPKTVAEQLRVPADLSITFTEDLTPYRDRKVRVLNGVHTGTFALALLSGVTLVSEAEADPRLGAFMRSLARAEIAPTLRAQHADIDHYADSILERFANTSIAHRWQNIALNAVSKWRSRLLPTVQDALVMQSDTRLMALSLAALLVLYREDRGTENSWVNDDADVVALISDIWDSELSIPDQVTCLLQAEALWGQDLSRLSPFSQQVGDWVSSLETDGVAATLERCLAETDAQRAVA